ncbi:nardilysin [Eurytemora carolleeae]|uniref:nardilysin n=1 Tax=Eurytemora carolleeae TaxID=1294199 RepID=UPI000C77506E|nr:nardilysin [Eurytemora carolleeae]|eukprot:XP_023349391.1 nardilysin-like [Eurytemora affinis]
MKKLFSVWIRTLYTSDINQDLTRIFSGSTMPKRTKVRAAPGPGAKKVKPNPAPFSITNDFQFSPVPELMRTATVLQTPEKASTDKKEYRAIRLKNGLTVLLISDCTYPLDKLDEEEALLAAKEETAAKGELDDEEEVSLIFKQCWLKAFSCLVWIAQIYGGIAEGHPMSKFMWGNTKSLSPEGMTDAEMSKRLHSFRDRHYSAQYMTLAVQSQHSLDTMQEWVEQIYSLIPNNGLELESFKHLDKPFLNPRYNKLYRIRPTQDIYQIDLTWSLPSTLDRYRSKPLHYLSWIIGHEGKGSLLSFLRLSPQEPNSRIFKEIQEIERLDYMYKEEKQPCDNVETLCENMQFFPAERFLDGDDLLFEFDPDFIKQCTDALVVESVNIFVKTCDISESELDQVEPWFNTKYSESEIPSAWILACKDHVYSSEFHLPEPNLFIAEDLSIRSADIEGSMYPVRLVEDELGELFYKKDESFLQPRAYIQYHIRSHLQLQCLENSIMLDLLANCVLQLMVEDVYPADLAQLNFSLYASETGLVIKVSGLSDKLPRLMETILKHLTAMSDTIQESLFNAVLEQQRKNYYNHSIKPSKLVRDVRLI